jgi:hypothetical protein
VLKYSGTYPNGYLKWADMVPEKTDVGTTGVPTNIYGSSVSLNGHSLEFVEPSIVPVAVGGVPSGFSFSSNSYYSAITATQQNWPISEVLRKVLYPYVAPTLSLSLKNDITGSIYAEAGTTIDATLEYLLTIYPRTADEYVSNYYILAQQNTESVIGVTSGTAYYDTSFSGLPGTTFSASIPLSISDPSSGSGGFSKYTMAYSDVPGTVITGYPLSFPYLNFGWSYSTTAEIRFIKPIYAGFSGTSNAVSFDPGLSYAGTNLTNFVNNNFNPLLPSLVKRIEPYPGINSAMSISASGSGRLYFIYPRANGIGDNLDESSLLSIVHVPRKSAPNGDPNGFVLYQKGNPTASAFYPGTFDMVNKVGRGEYVLWVSKYPCGYQGDGHFEFKFGATSSFTWPAGNGIMT